ncbi:toxin-antitoxin system, toxin component, PIN family protein [Streptomyces europaeiscabiei]|uniref:Toxin-antitoxin system, toxin component, PIN family protein n=1 Tax=Streptomyces europaeiscabiei TaxID=146819 RepID=A0AAJ2URG0_9ACTN|nr:toxin-antitoxin system, toxin component, PIN family protein [Streptomyces europaeiscabiei]MDX3135506.1 toxin-antitoxin system, toxin component, PIN family protein [Streptomyces europaeiscabiei]
MSPEFFLDRNLGRRVAEGLKTFGWTVHRIGDVFPDDVQDIPDEEWITHGLDRSWVPLSKDGRIKTRDLEIRPVPEREAVLFYLDNQQLRSAVMVERLVAHHDAIHRAVEKVGPAAYAVRHDRIERTWP